MRKKIIIPVLSALCVFFIFLTCTSTPQTADSGNGVEYYNDASIQEIKDLGYDYTYDDFTDMPREDKKIFSGAQGFGVYTKAGRGGKVIHVTNLEAEGPGSLREALNDVQPRIIVFDVAGIIDLKMEGLEIGTPYVTIAGQTAPSPGITLIRGGIAIRTHDVLLQHIRVRLGDGGDLKFQGWENDCIYTYGGEAYNVVIDHCSAAWSTDEGITTSGPRPLGPKATSHFVTVSNCIIAEGLNNATHSKGAHSKGSLVHDSTQFIAFINNLWSHNVDRNPYTKAFTLNLVANNIIYNPGSNAIRVGIVRSEWTPTDIDPLPARLTAVGNVMLHGENTIPSLAIVGTEGLVYMEDNIGLTKDGKEARQYMGRVTILKEKPVWPEGYKAMSSADVEKYIAAHCGARPKDRDSVDKRIIDDLVNRKGRIIDSQDDVGGYPSAKMVTRPVVIPEGVDIHEWLEQLAGELE